MLRPLFVLFLPAAGALAQPGYTDTPQLPGSPWRVHDAARPRPPVVAPAPAGDPIAPPGDAIVLFDGTSLDAWTGKSGKAGWAIAGGAMQVDRTGDIRTREAFGDIQLHVEWMAPREPAGEGQGRGNSGLFLLDRYEIQILDSFQNVTYADGQAAALYGQHPPLVDASRAPGEWQTYDVVFRAPQFEAGKLHRPATVTLFHNGILVHDRAEFLGPTAHRSLPRYEPHAATGPIRLQDHGDPVRFRNIWVRRLDPPDGAGAPTARAAVEALFTALVARDRAGCQRVLTGRCLHALASGDAGFLSVALTPEITVERWSIPDFDAGAGSVDASAEAVVREGQSRSAYAVQVTLVRRDGRWLVDAAR